jgi:hypothetical protein
MFFFLICRKTGREKNCVNKLIHASAANHYNSEYIICVCMCATMQSKSNYLKILEAQDWKTNVSIKIFLSLFNTKNSELTNHVDKDYYWTLLSQLNPDPILTTYILIIFAAFGLSWHFLTKILYRCLTSPLHATCLTHLTLQSKLAVFKMSCY